MGNSPGMMIDPNGEMFNPFVENNIMEQQSEMEQSISNEKGSRKTFFGLNALNTLMAAGGGGGNIMGTVHSGANAVLALGKSMMKVFNGLRSLFDRSDIQSSNSYAQNSIDPIGAVVESVEPSSVLEDKDKERIITANPKDDPLYIKMMEYDKMAVETTIKIETLSVLTTKGQIEEVVTTVIKSWQECCNVDIYKVNKDEIISDLKSSLTVLGIMLTSSVTEVRIAAGVISGGLATQAIYYSLKIHQLENKLADKYGDDWRNSKSYGRGFGGGGAKGTFYK